MHLLARSSATLDEVEDALDLEQTPAQCVILSFSDSDLTSLAHAWQENAQNLPTLRLASLKKLRHPMSVDVYIDSVIAKARIVVVRCLGGLDYWRYGLEQIASISRDNDILFAALPGDDRPDTRLAQLSTAKPDVLARLDAFFRAGGTQNLNNALAFLASETGSNISWQEPKLIPAISLWTPSGQKHLTTVSTPQPTEAPAVTKPVALILFYRANVMAADTAPIEALISATRKQGLTPVSVALTSLKDDHIAQKLQGLIKAHKPAIILNTTAFSAMRDDDTTVLDEADVPVLQVVLSTATYEAWNKSDRGLGPSDLAMNVVLPELDGRILSRAISFKSPADTNPALEHASVFNEPILDRVEFVASLAKNWVNLKSKPAIERKIALVVSNYPARAGRTGYAVGLDTPKSISEILSLLKSAGYQTGTGSDVWDTKILELFNEQDFETISVPLENYQRWYSQMPQTVRTSMQAAWGAPTEDPAFKDGKFFFSCLRAGNIVVLIQPDRGSTGDRKQSYHDTTLPPRHAYAALYAHLRHEQQIDAHIHLGTHGTLEWLPGKALALSKDCFPEVVLGPLPVIYPFIVNNPGEAVQAKRRLGAVTLGHLTPPLREAGLSGALADLEGLVDEYAQADGVDKRRMELLEKEIIEEAWRSSLAADCGMLKEDTPREAIAKLDAQLCDIKELSIRDGLHVYGQPPDEQHAKALSEAMAASAGSMAHEHAQVSQRLHQSATNERQALLKALDGRRIPAGPAGAPSRGRMDVLPTGRNLTSVDPRAIPTRTAAKIGKRAADEIIRRHLQDFGEYPRALVIDLWASASLRTGGDDLAQAFAYLGVRPIWDLASNRVTGIEVIPQAKMERPRIDTTLRISGLFRDIFPTQIALYHMAVAQVANLEEEDECNPLAASRRAGKSLSRVFSSAPGTFGAAVADVALDGNWSDIEDLARAYINASKHAVDRSGKSHEAEDNFLERVATADALIHPQDDRERDILDGDGVADFAGGFSAAARMLGNNVALYHLDTSRPQTPIARTFNEEIVRIARGRLSNPQWIERMLEHSHRGVAEIAQGVDALFAFAATTREVPSHLFDALHDALIAPSQVADKMIASNPLAAQAIAERLHEAIKRGLWTSRRNTVLMELDLIIERATKTISQEKPLSGTKGDNP